jgi:hypothetical protein
MMKLERSFVLKYRYKKKARVAGPSLFVGVTSVMYIVAIFVARQARRAP